MNAIQKALESVESDGVPLDDMEYDTLHLMSASLVATTESYLSAIKSAEDAIERIETVRTVLEYQPQPNDASRALVDETLRGALGNSVVSVEQLLPTLHVENSVLSTESIRSTVSNALSRILTYIKRVLENMADLWNSLLSMSKWVRFTANNGLNRVKSNKGLSPSQLTFDYKGDTNRLMINGAVYKSNAQYLANLVELRRQLEYFTGDHVKVVTKIGDGLLAAITTKNTPQRALEQSVQAFSLMNYSTVSGMVRGRNQTDVRFEGGTVDAAPSLLGNRTVFIPKDQGVASGLSLLMQAQEIRKRGISLLHTNENQAKLGGGAVLPVMSTSEAEAVLSECVKISVLIDQYDSRPRTTLSRKIRTITDAYKRMCDDASKANLSNEDRAYHNSVGRFVTQYTTLVNSPTDSLIVHALGICRVTIALANRSMQYYR